MHHPLLVTYTHICFSVVFTFRQPFSLFIVHISSSFSLFIIFILAMTFRHCSASPLFICGIYSADFFAINHSLIHHHLFSSHLWSWSSRAIRPSDRTTPLTIGKTSVNINASRYKNTLYSCKGITFSSGSLTVL